MNFDIKTEQLSGDAYVISLAGEVDLYTAPEFKQQLLEVIGQGGKEVVVDFIGTTFIDSTTLGVLVGGVKRLRTNDGQLSLVCSDRNITKIFEITGLDKVFTIYPDARGGRVGAGSTAGLKRKYRVGALGAGLAAAALLAAGCGYGGAANAGGQRPDTQSGQQLFTQSCGTCHTLSAAGTSGTIGPNLDNAFAADVQEGYPQSVIENVVLDQIRLGSGPGPIATYSNGKLGNFKVQTQMPANIVKGQDALDVAAYVASVAGQSGYTTSASFASFGTNGETIFKGAGCGGCHTLAAAGASGTAGPNLDQIASTPRSRSSPNR